MDFEVKTYSRKQAGVIYSAVKRGDVEASKSVISRMYDMAGSVEFFSHEEYAEIMNFKTCIEAAIKSIFENDYASATAVLAEIA